MFYKCLDDRRYKSFRKGNIYLIKDIYIFHRHYPEDWMEVLPYPSIKDLASILDGNRNTIKAIKQWEDHKRTNKDRYRMLDIIRYLFFKKLLNREL